jgi:putative FmdB family regulatory protein
MPIYEYACEKCEREFEVEQRITDPPLKSCPQCRSRKVKRLISQTSFVLKGGGWYSDLYSSKKESGGARTDAAGSDSGGKSASDGDAGSGGKGAGDAGSGGKGAGDAGSGGTSSETKKTDAAKTPSAKGGKGGKKGSRAAA